MAGWLRDWSWWCCISRICDFIRGARLVTRTVLLSSLIRDFVIVSCYVCFFRGNAIANLGFFQASRRWYGCYSTKYMVTHTVCDEYIRIIFPSHYDTHDSNCIVRCAVYRLSPWAQSHDRLDRPPTSWSSFLPWRGSSVHGKKPINQGAGRLLTALCIVISCILRLPVLRTGFDVWWSLARIESFRWNPCYTSLQFLQTFLHVYGFNFTSITVLRVYKPG